MTHRLVSQSPAECSVVVSVSAMTTCASVMSIGFGNAKRSTNDKQWTLFHFVVNATEVLAE